MENTCSIKLLKKAYIGSGIRMSGGKGTIPFNNEPMAGLKIIDYSKLGFLIDHEYLPRQIWVDFDQLPLTRLSITHGVIEDEITFVENIVDHQMQLIRTLDTEYIDLLYKEEELENKKGDIIPISKAIVGHWYKGAQCKDGLEMVYLGNWYQKNIIVKYNHDYTYHLTLETPRRAFFACKEGKLWDILSFPISNKRIKDLIDLYDDSNLFNNKEIIKEMIYKSKNHRNYNSSYYKNNQIPVTSPELSFHYVHPVETDIIIQKDSHTGIYLANTKENINSKAYEFVNENFRCKLETSIVNIGGWSNKTIVGEIEF